MLKGFNRIVKIVWPKYKEKERKQEFLDRLKGLTEIQIKDGTPVGVTFMVSDDGTGHVDNYFHIGSNEWISWGTTPKPDGKVTQTFNTRELEMHLTDLLRNAKPNGQINMIDESCCIVLDK